MFPGFTSLYKDSQGFVHLYFFPGISDNNKPIYMPLDLTQIKYEYKFTKHSDGAIDYAFEDKNITKITSSLVDKKTGKAVVNTVSL